jgi:WD40 repeat protein
VEKPIVFILFIGMILVGLGCGPDFESQSVDKTESLTGPSQQDSDDLSGNSTQTVSPESIPTVLSTATPEMVQEGTPIPSFLQIVTVENAWMLAPLAVWNDGLTGSNWTSGMIRYPKLVLSGDGGYLYAVDRIFSDGTVEKWDLQNGNIEAQFGLIEEFLGYVDISSNGKMLASGEEYAVRFWNMEEDPRLVSEFEVLQAFSGASIQALEFDSTNLMLALGFQDGSVSIYTSRGWSGYRFLTSHHARVANLIFSSDSRWLISAAVNGSIFAWPAPEEENRYGEITPMIINEMGEPVESMVFSMDDERLAVQAGRQLFMYDMQTRQRIWAADLPEIRLFDLPEEEFFPEFNYLHVVSDGRDSLTFSPDGSLLACGNMDGDILLMDAGSGEVLSTILAHRGSVISLLFDLDGTLLISSGYDGTIRLWGIPEK